MAVHNNTCSKHSIQQYMIYVRRCFTNRSPTVIRRLYCGLVRPIIENNSPAWNPWLKKDIECLEKVQRQCERLCQENLRLQPLTYRRYRADMCETYKLLHGHYKLDPSNLIEPSTTTQLRGHQNKLSKTYARTEVRQKFFSNCIVDGWNRPSNEAVMARTPTNFKTRLDLSNY